MKNILYYLFTGVDFIILNISAANACSLSIEEDTLGAQLEAVAVAGFLGYGRKVISSKVEDLSYSFYASPSIYDPNIAGCPETVATATITVVYETDFSVCTERVGVISSRSTYEIVKNYEQKENYSCVNKYI